MNVKQGLVAGLLALVALVPITASAETLTIVGTGDGVVVLNAIGEAYSRTQSGVTVTVPESIGSGGAIKAVGNDEQVLGRVARGIKDKEMHHGLTYVPYAKVPVVFFVNSGVDVDAVTSEQILGIYRGDIKNWSDVGGAPGKLRVVRREDGDSSLSRLQKSFPGFSDIAMTERAKTVFSTPETIDLVEKKAGTIGFGPFDVAKHAHVKVLKVDGMAPTDAAYPSVTTLGLVFKESNNTGSVKQFIDYATSPAVADVIRQAGGTSN